MAAIKMPRLNNEATEKLKVSNRYHENDSGFTFFVSIKEIF
jgi:hypothetical protein